MTEFHAGLGNRSRIVAAWIGRGNVLNELQRYEEGLDSFERALRIEPENAFGWLCRLRPFAAAPA